MKVLLVCGVAAGLSWLLTAVLRRYALSHSMLDIPNQRSSHTAPTPRGGGLAIVVSFLSLTCFLGIIGNLSISVLIALSGAGAWVALIGFLDDHGHIPARWRLLAHFAGSPRHGMVYGHYYLAREWVRAGHQVTIMAAGFAHTRFNQPIQSRHLTEEMIDGIRYHLGAHPVLRSFRPPWPGPKYPVLCKRHINRIPCSLLRSASPA